MWISSCCRDENAAQKAKAELDALSEKLNEENRILKANPKEEAEIPKSASAAEPVVVRRVLVTDRQISIQTNLTGGSTSVTGGSGRPAGSCTCETVLLLGLDHHWHTW